MDSSGEEISYTEISSAKTDTHSSTVGSDSDSSSSDSHSSSNHSSTDSDSSSNDSDSSTNDSTDSESTDSDSSSNDSDSSTNDSTDSESSSTDSDSSSTNTSTHLKPLSITKKGAKVAFKCPVCNYKCASTGRVYAHLVEKHGRKKFECDKCNFSTANKTSLLNHKRCYCKNRNIMKKKKKQVQDIPEDNVKKPKSKIINNRVIFICQYCNTYTGKSSGVIFSHMCQQHGIKKLTCGNCSFKTANRTSFYNHITRYCKN